MGSATKQYEVGDRVARRCLCSSRPGTVTAVLEGDLAGMVEVRLPGGEVVLPTSELVHIAEEEE